MSEEQSDKLKLNLKTTDTNRFKIEADQPTEQPGKLNLKTTDANRFKIEADQPTEQPVAKAPQANAKPA